MAKLNQNHTRIKQNTSISNKFNLNSTKNNRIQRNVQENQKKMREIKKINKIQQETHQKQTKSKPNEKNNKNQQKRMQIKQNALILAKFNQKTHANQTECINFGKIQSESHQN